MVIAQLIVASYRCQSIFCYLYLKAKYDAKNSLFTVVGVHEAGLMSTSYRCCGGKNLGRRPAQCFTDLIRFEGEFYCAFREGAAHVPDSEGTDGYVVAAFSKVNEM